MSAGRLQLYDKRAGPRDRTSRLLVRLRLPAAGGTPARERLGLAWEVATALRRTTGDPYMSEAVQGVRGLDGHFQVDLA